MSEAEMHRRNFLQTGALAGASAVALSQVGAAADDAPASKPTLPTRKLGKTGVDVTILNQGTWRASGLPRILRVAYASGIRYFDTAQSYGSEPAIKTWMQENPDVRKSIFLVTKDHPHEPKEMMKLVDKRLEALGTDHLDLFFWHAMGDAKQPIGLVKSAEYGKAIEDLKKSGKVKFVGFSTHCENRSEYISAAAEGGFVDAIMVKFNPFLEKDAPLNKALDLAWQKGIGLISMKQVAGQFGDAKAGGEGEIDKVIEKYAPVLKEKNLTPFQGLLHAIWTDERIATSCVSMRNTDQIRDNVDAAKRFEPLKQAELKQLHNATLAAGPTMCAGCEGQCSVAGKTDAKLGEITRFLTYLDHHGYRRDARDGYAALSASDKNWSDADLEAARHACPSKLDFAQLLPRAAEHLS